MKKKLGRTLALMLALILTVSAFADYYVSVRADEGENTSASQAQIESGIEGFIITSVGVSMNGEPLEEADHVYSGAEIEIALKFMLVNEKRVPDGTEFSPQEFVLDTSNWDLKGIELSNTQYETLYFWSKAVGYYYIENGNIHIIINDEKFYQNETNREGGISFSGIVERTDDVKQDGEEKKIGIGDSAVLKDYYLTDTESFVSVNKSLDGGLYSVGEKYYQNYIVTVKAENGTVHNIKLSDKPDNGLTNPTGVTIKINRAGSSEEKTYDSLEDALDYINNIDNLYMGESIDICYTMEVSPDIFDEGVQGYGNKVSGTYISNRSKEPKNTGEGYAWITATATTNGPEVSKEGLEYIVYNGKGHVKWKITIKLNDLYDESKTSLDKYIDTIDDIPGYGLNNKLEKFKLDLSNFINEGNGVYTYEYDMEVTDEVYKSLVDVTVSNEVKVKFNGIDDTYDKVGNFTIKHTGEHTDASIEKKLVSVDENWVEPQEPTKKGILLTWEIEVSDIPEGVTEFSIKDEARHWNNDRGKQELLRQIYLTDLFENTDALVVDKLDDSWEITDAGNDIIESVTFWYDDGKYSYNTIQFKNEYIDRVVTEGNGTIKIRVQTLITENATGHEYGNGAKVSYNYREGDTQKNWESAESRDIFHYKKGLLKKTGTVIEGKNAIAYSIKVMVPFLGIKEYDENKHFVITDNLPDGLSVDKDTITVQLTDQWGGNVRVKNSDMKYKYNLDDYLEDNLEKQRLTVDITPTLNLLEQIQGYPNGTSDGYYLTVNFTAKVKNQEAFLNEGKTVEYANSASGTYAGDSIGEDTATNELTIAKMVEKKGEYNKSSAPYAKYTVHVNRGGVTLLDGKTPLTAVDKLGSALTFVDNDASHAVKVYEFGEWDKAQDLSEDEYSYKFSADKKTLTFTKLPDGKHLLIEYWVYVDFENVKKLDESNAGNDFFLQGSTSKQAKGGYQFSGDTFTPKGWVRSKVGTIILYKYWTNADGDMVALEGSVFRLKKMRIENGELVDDEVIRDEIKITNGNRAGEGKIVIDNLPVNQILALEETKADEGFSIGKPYYFVVDGTTIFDSDTLEILKKYNIQSFYTDNNNILEYENSPINSAWIKIAKKWEETDTDTNTKKLSWDEIKGSLYFAIKNVKGQTVRTLTGEDLVSVESDGTTRYESAEIPVEPGTYTVLETIDTNSDIKDYEVETAYIVEAGGNKIQEGNIAKTDNINLHAAKDGVTVVYTNTYTYNDTETFDVKISKRALTGAEDEIEGALFKLTEDKESPDFHTFFWLSGNKPYEGKPYELKLKPGNYTLTEIQAPKGYKKAADVKFTVEEDGEITIAPPGTETENKDDDHRTVVMKDEPLDLEVRKIAVVKEDTIDVNGAMLALYDRSDLDNDYNPFSGREPLYEWESKVGESEPIGKYLYANDKWTYVLVETSVPKDGGYGYSKKIEFKVNEDGKIYNLKYVGGSEAVITQNTTDDNTEGNRILMEDKVISVRLSKVDLQGRAIDGKAIISVYKKADIDKETGNPLPNKEPIETAIFDNSSAPYKFGSKLLPGEKYVFVETGIPDGYKKADYIEFEVKEDGTVQVYGGVEQEDDVYLMHDARVGEKISSLVIYKTVSGDLTLDEINGGLKFRVEKVSGDGDPYYKEYTIAKDFVKENDKYVLKLPPLPLGIYKVTEIYKGKTPDDMKLEVSYKIDNGSEQRDLNPNNEYFETGNIDLTDGERHIVTYNNAYQYRMGAIKLTKNLDFVGSETKQDDKVVGKLNFHIYKVINSGEPDERKEEIKDSPVSGSLLNWNSTYKVYEYEIKVPIGTYIVEEKYESIDGYKMTTTHTVNDSEDSRAETVYETSKQVVREQEQDQDSLKIGFSNSYVQTHSVVISKKSMTTKAELANATWEITGKNLDGTSITPIEWTTREDTTTGIVEPHEVALEPGEYTLTETKAPIGYKKAADIEFSLDGNGKVTITSGQTNALEDDKTVIIWDEPLDVEVDKVTLGGGAEVKGAKLCLYDSKGKKLAEHVSHVSDENEVWQIGEYLQIGEYRQLSEKYKLVEELAPNGYGYSEAIEFRVDNDGNIKDVSYSGGSKNVKLSDTKDGAVDNKILMEDRPISIKLSKVELGSHPTKELEGAIIGIYYAKDVDDNGRLKYPDTKPLEAWKSDGGYHEFGTKLEADCNYVFVETVAPNGYQFATSIRFTINKDGRVGNVSTITGGKVNTTVTGGDTVYLMEDDIYTDTEPRAALVLTKSIEGKSISSADITKTNLRFRVESIDVSPAYDQVFYVGGVGFEWDGKKYVQHIYNLIPGKYKVTELWDDSADSGIVCTGQTWEIVRTGASGTGPTHGTGVTTGEFKLENGDTNEINYTNTYGEGGTLIITKTISGNATKEEVEGTLTFTVTENSTNKKDTYTLKDDFEYNSATKKWTKELALTAGGYTIEESVKAPDGKTCTTKYTVTGGTSRNDTGKRASNVIVENGGTTTVDYNNTYTASTNSKDDSKDNNKDNSKDNNKNSSKDKSKGKSKSADDGDDDSFVVTKLVKNIAASLTETGDGAIIGIWLLLLVLSIAGMVIGIFALLRKNKKE